MHAIYLAVIKFCRYYSCLLSTPNAKLYKTATLRKSYERKIPATMTQRRPLYTVLTHPSQIILLASLPIGKVTCGEPKDTAYIYEEGCLKILTTDC